MKKLKIAIVGATGMVGRTFLKVLEEQGFSDCEYTLMASKNSAATTLPFFGKDYIVEELSETSFDTGCDIALFSAGGKTSEIFAPIAAERGAIVIDNSSQWRMEPNVPLVVPEVNPHDIDWNDGIIANPNCSTIQAVVALAPIYKRYGIKRIIYTTYQSVSGAGIKGCEDLDRGIEAYVEGKEFIPQKFPHPIFDNCIPQIDSFLDNGYTKEEQKMIDETRKIFNDDAIEITATCVRVPVFGAHSESINVELKKDYRIDDVRALLEDSPGIKLWDDPLSEVYPLAAAATESDEVFVGRLRRDNSVKNGLNLWVVADNIRKGAATNAVQIALLLIEKWNSQ